MAQADDPEVPDREPRPAASSSRFWQRYSGRPAPPDDDQRPGAATGGAGESAGDAGPAGNAGSVGEAGSADDAASAGSPGGEGLHHGHVEGHQCLDWCPICRGAELLREAVPPELQEQFKTVQRDALLLAQAMIEAHLERLKRDTADDAPDISSIPID